MPIKEMFSREINTKLAYWCCLRWTPTCLSVGSTLRGIPRLGEQLDAQRDPCMSLLTRATRAPS